MEVDQGAPVGQVPFMSDRWREMFRHAVSEARRLGLAVNMNNDAGWNGSGGPWIRPEQSMQEVVWTETEVTGPKHFEGVLPCPEARADYYRDIAVLAVPGAGPYRIPDFESKAAFQTPRPAPGKPAATVSSPTSSSPAGSCDLTARMAADGRHHLGRAGGQVDDPPPGSHHHRRGERPRTGKRPRPGVRQAQPRWASRRTSRD